jgi:hypothetical protein
MKRLAAIAFGVLAIGAMAGAAHAFNRFPNATCTDSVSIFQCNNPSFGACYPTGGAGVPGDTVAGVAGIITAIDVIPTGYGIYIQNSGGAPWGGIDVFYGGTNYADPAIFNFAQGDSVVIEFAAVENFQGSKEVIYPNNAFAGPNMVMRKVNIGNALPPFHVGLPGELNRIYSDSLHALQWQGALVRVNQSAPGAMHVARTVGLSFVRDFYVVDDSAPSDTIYIDGGTFVNYGRPSVGTLISYVQGIFDHRTQGSKIMIRDANDIGALTPPQTDRAYCVGAGKIRVEYDRNVTTASATNVNNYSLTASGGTVNSVVMDGQSNAILDVTNGLNSGDREIVQVCDIVGLANNIQMSTCFADTLTYGVLSVRELSAPNPDSLTSWPGPPVCVDKSRFAGTSGQINMGEFGRSWTSFFGTETGKYGNLDYMEDEVPSSLGKHGGITVFASPNLLNPGSSYLVAGRVQEFFGETEFAAITYEKNLGPAAIPAPIPVIVATVGRDSCPVVADSSLARGEMFESMLVKLHLVKVVLRFPPTVPTNGWHVTGESPAFTDTIFCQNLNSVLGTASSSNPNYPALGSVCDITGVVHYDSGSFRVCPRRASDIVILGTAGVPPSTPGKLSFAVYPNPGHRQNIAFTLPNATHVDLGVFDITGRRVATLASGNLPAAEYSRGWSGRDDSGHKVGAGVFFYRLVAGSETRTIRAIMLGN